MQEQYSAEDSVCESGRNPFRPRSRAVSSVTFYRHFSRVIIFHIRASLVDFKGVLGVKFRFQRVE